MSSSQEGVQLSTYRPRISRLFFFFLRIAKEEVQKGLKWEFAAVPWLSSLGPAPAPFSAPVPRPGTPHSDAHRC